jgi:hypothetical protein
VFEPILKWFMMVAARLGVVLNRLQTQQRRQQLCGPVSRCVTVWVCECVREQQ